VPHVRVYTAYTADPVRASVPSLTAPNVLRRPNRNAGHEREMRPRRQHRDSAHVIEDFTLQSGEQAFYREGEAVKERECPTTGRGRNMSSAAAACRNAEGELIQQQRAAMLRYMARTF